MRGRLSVVTTGKDSFEDTMPRELAHIEGFCCLDVLGGPYSPSFSSSKSLLISNPILLVTVVVNCFGWTKSTGAGVDIFSLFSKNFLFRLIEYLCVAFTRF